MTADARTWIESVVDQEECAALTGLLVSHRSYPGEELAVQQAVYHWLADHGLDPQWQQTEDPNRPNVIAVIDNGPGRTLLLNGHVDTVLAVEGWETDPWTPTRVDDRLYGLGALDMKAGVAMNMLATRALAGARDRWSGRVVFTSVVDEEAYSIGARAMLEQGISGDFAIVTESCSTGAIGSVGKVLVEVDVHGKAAHGSLPHEGINAAIEGGKFAAKLDTVPIPAHPRMNGNQTILSFLSGNAQYVITVPELAKIVVNRMIVTGETSEGVRDQYRALADSLGSPATFDVRIAPPYYPAWECDPNDPTILLFTQSYRDEYGIDPEWTYFGFGDANLIWDKLRIPTIMFGASGEGFHKCNEWVSVPSIAAATRILLATALRMMPPAQAS